MESLTIKSLSDLNAIKADEYVHVAMRKSADEAKQYEGKTYRKNVLICGGTGCTSSDSEKLIPAMKEHNYHVAIRPLDLVLGMTGTHSSFVKTFKKVAAEEDVPLYKLIAAVSAVNKDNPTETFMHEKAQSLKK